MADGYVRDGSFATQNFGTAGRLVAKAVKYPSYTRQVYLKFDLSALTPEHDRVKLRLYGSRDPGATCKATTIETVRGVLNDAWTESGVKWNNRPTVGAIIASTRVSGTVPRWYEWDVTNYVLARKAAGSAVATLAVVMQAPPANDESYDVFYSRTSGAEPELVFTDSAPPPTVQLPASGDAYVRDGAHETEGAGSASELIVKNVDYESYTRQALLKFDVSGAPEAAQQVILRVYGSRDPTADTVTTSTMESVYGVDASSWDEAGVSWSNRPDYGDKLDTAEVSTQEPQWYEWDVTSFVLAQKSAGHGAVSFAMVMDEMPDNDEGYDSFASREAAANGPQLIFVGGGNISAPPVPTPPPAPSATPVPTPEPTPEPTATPAPTATPIPTEPPQPSATPVPTVAPTATPRPTATPVPTVAPTATPRPTATPVPTVAPTATPRPTATPVPTVAPTATPRPTATPPITTGQGTDFYLDAATGNDSDSGLTPAAAWKTLAPVNATTFDPGDRLLIRSGTRYVGHLALQGSGQASAPIILTSYGTGAKPVIDGNGLMETVLLQNEEYWEISNLEITNTGPTRVAGRRGVLVKATDFGTVHHIVLNNLYVHDVNGSNMKSSGGGHGICMTAGGAITPSNFDDAQIKNCVIERTDRNGVNIGNDNYWRVNWKPNTRVLVEGNRLLDIGGDGIVVVSCESPLVQYNVLTGGRQRAWDAAAGIWPWSCDNAVFQYNEVSGMAGTVDGQAFDCDYNCNNTLFQYNYSHDNEGGFMLLCDDGTKNVRAKNVGNVGSVIRYNVSENDGTRTFQVAGPVRDALIYNNVFYTAAGAPQMAVVSYNGWGLGMPTNIRFKNNVFYGTSNSKFVWNGWTPATFTNNCFYGVFNNVPADSGKITSDPQFVAPGTGGSGLNSVAGYKLKNTSPLIGSGVIIDSNGGEDFWGFGVDDITRPSIGADNN